MRGLLIIALAAALGGCASTPPSWDNGPPDGQAPSLDNQGASWRRAEAPKGALDLAELFALAEQLNPTLQAARERVEAGRGRELQAGLWPNPSLQVSGEFETSRPRFATSTRRVMIGQPVVLSGRLGLAQAAERAALAADELDIGAVRHSIYGAVHQVWVDVVYLGEATQIQFELIDMAEEIAETLEQAAQDGRATAADAERARLAAMRLRGDLLGLITARTVATEQLMALLGGIAISPTHVVGSLATGVPFGEVAVERDSVVAAHPELVAAEARVAAARQAMGLAKREWLPDVEVLVGASYNDNTDETMGEVGLGIGLPIFNRNQGRIREAEAQVREAEALRDEVEQRLTAELATLFQLLSELDTLAEDYATAVEPHSLRALESARAGFAAGKDSPLGLVDALRSMAETRRQTAEYRYQMNSALAAFRHFNRFGSEEAAGLEN